VLSAHLEKGNKQPSAAKKQNPLLTVEFEKYISKITISNDWMCIKKGELKSEEMSTVSTMDDFFDEDVDFPMEPTPTGLETRPSTAFTGPIFFSSNHNSETPLSTADATNIINNHNAVVDQFGQATVVATNSAPVNITSLLAALLVLMKEKQKEEL